MGSEQQNAPAPPTYESATQNPQAYPGAAPGPPPQAYNTAPPAQVYVQQHPPPPPTNVVVMQPGVTYVQTNPTVVAVHEVKMAPCFHPYPEFCPYCRITATTRVRYVGGSMMCIFLILAIFFFPFIFFICCNAFKDAHHYCANCHRLIAIKRR